MRDAVHSDAKQTARHIYQTFRETDEFQPLRELYVNSLQAGATRIDVDIDQKLFAEERVCRMVWMDNGHGMNGDTDPVTGKNHLKDFFTQFGGSGRPIGPKEEGNYGMGSKVALLPWTDVAVLSWTPETPDGRGIVLVSDEKEEIYRLERFDMDGVMESVFVVDGDEEYGHLKPDWITDHGTIVVLLGRGDSRNTFFLEGHPRRSSFKNSVTSYARRLSGGLEQRFAEFPQNAKVRYRDLVAGPDRVLGAGDLSHSYMREVYGCLRRRMGDNLVDHGTVDLDWGFKAHWYYWEPISLETRSKTEAAIEKAEKAGDYETADKLYKKLQKEPDYFMYPNNGKGFVVPAFRSPGTGNLLELIGYQTHSAHLGRWGLVGPLTSRVGIVLEGPTYSDKTGVGLYTAASRDMLKYNGHGIAGPLPIERLAERFRERMPARLEEERRRFFSTSTSSDDGRLRRALKSLSKFRSEVVAVLAGRGGSLGGIGPTRGGPNSSGKGSGSGKGSKTPSKRPGGTGEQKAHTTRVSLPPPEVLLASELEDRGHSLLHEGYYLVKSLGVSPDGARTYVINDNDPFYAASVELALKDIDRVLQDEAKGKIGQYYKEHLAAHVVVIEALQRRRDKTDKYRATWDADEVNEVLMNEIALSGMLLNPIRDREMLRPIIAGLLARKPKSVPAA